MKNQGKGNGGYRHRHGQEQNQIDDEKNQGNSTSRPQCLRLRKRDGSCKNINKKEDKK